MSARAEYDQRMRTEGIWLRFLSGPGIESLDISRAEIIDAVADVVTARGRDVKDAIRVAQEVNDAADKVLASGALSPW